MRVRDRVKVRNGVCETDEVTVRMGVGENARDEIRILQQLPWPF